MWEAYSLFKRHHIKVVIPLQMPLRILAVTNSVRPGDLNNTNLCLSLLGLF